MPIFTVIAFEDKEEIKNKIDSLYSDNFPALNDSVWFVKSNDTASEISEGLGINPEGKNTGVVVKNESWYGYADAKLWDWAEKRAEKRG